MAGHIAITAFGPFPGVAENPTQRLHDYFLDQSEKLPAGCSLHMLDVDYREVTKQLDAILETRPAALLLTGYSNLAKAITLEMQASSICAADKPDIAGHVPQLAGDGHCLRTALDLDTMRSRLTKAKLPAEISHDAGQYLCNFSFHYGLSHFERQGDRPHALFIHFPALIGSELAKSSNHAMTLADMAAGLSLIAQLVEEQLRTV